MGIGGNLLRSIVKATKIVVDATKVVVDAIKVVVDLTKAVVGTNADGHSVNTISGKVKQLLEHTHAVGEVTPELANPILLTKAAGAWAAYPTPTEIIAAGAITDDFDLHWAVISALSANGDYTLQLYQGAALSETVIATIAVTRNAVQSQEGAIPVITPLIAGSTRISAALSSGNAAQDTAEIKVMYHRY